jgi:co-chaperonin GroES (HSP10)
MVPKDTVIYVPKSVQSVKVHEGTVVRLGPDVNHLSIGDHVLFGQYAGVQITRDGEAYIMMDEDDVLAFVRESKPITAGKDN